MGMGGGGGGGLDRKMKVWDEKKAVKKADALSAQSGSRRGKAPGIMASRGAAVGVVRR